jgi:Zn-dependent peptidase ImmA (M78 family)
MATVEVKPEVIAWARDRAGLTDDALTRKFPRFPAWLTGEVQPTFRQLEALARMTFTPLGYFFLSQPPEDRLPIPDLRTVRDQPVRRPSPNLLETVEMMQRRQSWMRDFLLEEREDPLPFVGSFSTDSDVLEVAASIRGVLGIDAGWASNQRTWTDALSALRDRMEQAGIMVVVSSVVGNDTHRKLSTDEFRGFVLHDQFAPLIFTNGADFKSAQMFTMAHELAHVWVGQSGVFNLRATEPSDNEVEIFCNRIAAEFLISQSEARAAWQSAELERDPFQAMARRFKVSTIVAARRLRDLGLITTQRFFGFYEEYQQDERRKAQKKSDGGDFYNTQNVRVGKRFASFVIRAAREGRILYKDAYTLTGLYGKTFDRYAQSLGFRTAA